MPRTSRNKPGCFECSRRRIICDLTSPTCRKCAKKGIQCSGQTRFRFNTGIANRGHFKGVELTIDANAETVAPSTLRWQDAAPADHPEKPADRSTEANIDNITIEEVQRAELIPGLVASSIDLLPNGVSSLFHHFSTVICPHMVIFDNNNGWRDIVLPLAVHDDLIQRAVCVTAAQHITLQRPEHRHRVEEQRLKAIRQLSIEATASGLTQSRMLSAWVALLVLLVGETVTGGSDYRQLHRALLSFCNAFRQAQEIAPGVQAFLDQQTDLFTALSQPTNITTPPFEQGHFEKQFGFMNSQLTCDEGEAQRLNLIYVAMQVAHLLYTASLAADEQRTQDFFIKLITVCRAIPSNSPGEHALIWPYFMGAAQSNDLTERDFFIARMRAVHHRTGFGNIKASIDRLQLVWDSKKTRPWAQTLPEVCPVLIM